MENKQGFMFIRTTDAGTLQRHLTDDCQLLSDVLEEFQYFLKGCGYHFKGNIEIVSEEE